MPVRHRALGDELAAPEPKRCKHCDESRSSCGGGGGSEDSEGRASWRVTLDHDLVETLSAIYPEWFKQPRRDRSRAASPAHSPVRSLASPLTPDTPTDDNFSSGAEEMAGRQASCSGASEPPSSPPRVSPPKVVVDDSPLQPAMGKHKESLKVKLMMRRPINQLVAQGIMPPLKTPPAYFKQRVQLERAKTGDLLKAKIQSRPDRQELERRHILEQESHVDPSLAEKQRMLKKARLADQLNDQLSHRPGPLELIKKNILHTEEDIETAVKSGVLAFKATSEGASGRPQHPSAYCGPPEEASPSPSPPAALSPASVASTPQHPAPGKDKGRKKCKQKPKSRFKFHEYKGPPNAQKASSPPDSTETPYELLLQQQQLLLQLMLPASPAPSSAASVASDTSDALGAPPPPPPPPPLAAPFALAAARFEDMKVSDLRAECKRRNLRVSGPKPQLIDRLRPYLEMQEEAPRSPVSVASPDSKAESEPCDDIVQSQRRLIEELERQLEESRQQLEAVRREAAGAAASDQSRRLLQAHLCVTQLRAKLDALQQPSNPAPAPQRYVLAAPDTTPDRLVRLFTVTPPSATGDGSSDATSGKANQAYILNGVKVVPIAILPTTHYEPERAPPPPPPPPPPPVPQLPVPAMLHDNAEDSQIMDDVLEILVENGELPPSAVGDVTPNRSLDAGYLTAGSSEFTPTDVLSDDILGDSHVRDSLAADELQRELDDIQNEIMSHADLNAISDRCDIDSSVTDIDHDLNVDLLANNEFNANFAGSDSTSCNHEDFFGRFLGEDTPGAMDIDDDAPERMSMTPLTNGDILDHSRPGFVDMNELSLPSFHDEDTRHGGFEERPCEFDFKDFDLSSSMNMNVDGDGYDYVHAQLIPNLFGRGHTPQCDPVLGGVLARPAPRPARKHYSWDKIEYDAT
ncbi:proline-rich protein 36 isoform X1 [Maniola jurtina]|uniref:proline-rich protein 36 isoform X1 n=2 Tax=Maniola jurtina TaxID=191418 RepID=UPI001E68CD46|nr:proline-rich protein 36 isoform X1 [Maniola jurtina]